MSADDTWRMRDIPCPNPAVIAAVRAGFAGSRQAWPACREFGLVAAGLRPAALKTFLIADDGSLAAGWHKSMWDPSPLLESLRTAGVAVHVFPSFDSATMATVVVSPSERRTLRIKRCLAELVSSPDVARRRTAEIRLGVLLGYTGPGIEAWMGKRPRADTSTVDAGLDPRDRWFVDSVIAADPAGLAQGVARVARLGAGFRACYGDLHPEGETPNRMRPPNPRTTSELSP